MAKFIKQILESFGNDSNAKLKALRLFLAFFLIIFLFGKNNFNPDKFEILIKLIEVFK